MAKRQYANLSIGQIEGLAAKHSDDLAILLQLLDEIKYRTSFAATAAQISITQRVREIEVKQNKRPQERAANKNSEEFKNTDSRNESEIETLRKQLAEAHRQMAALKAQTRTDARSETEKLFLRVGLNADCTDFVLRATRTAYRKALHPDVHAEKHKKEANRRFLETERIFETLFKLRNL